MAPARTSFLRESAGRRHAVRTARHTRKAGCSRRKESTVKRSFQGFQKVSDVVETQPWPEFAEILRRYFEWRRWLSRPLGKAGAKRFVDYLFKGQAALPSLGAQLRFHVFIESKGRTHTVMLWR